MFDTDPPAPERHRAPRGRGRLARRTPLLLTLEAEIDELLERQFAARGRREPLSRSIAGKVSDLLVRGQWAFARAPRELAVPPFGNEVSAGEAVVALFKLRAVLTAHYGVPKAWSSRRPAPAARRREP